MQVYATTGQNWQATLYRHVPLLDPCSTCVPGYEAVDAPALCATGPQISERRGTSHGDDVALPFLSYGGSSVLSLALTIGMVLALTRERPPTRILP